MTVTNWSTIWYYTYMVNSQTEMNWLFFFDQVVLRVTFSFSKSPVLFGVEGRLVKHFVFKLQLRSTLNYFSALYYFYSIYYTDGIIDMWSELLYAFSLSVD